MKITLDFLGRAYLANLSRRRAMECEDNASSTSLDKQRVDWETEARYAEEMAIRLDNGEELVIDRPPARVAKPDLDSNYLNESKERTDA